jgi:two-component system LytT family response regulator
MTYKCLIVDDEAPAHKVLQSHITKTDLLEIAGDVYDGKEAIDFMLNTKVDLLFLDIDMPKLSGLELLQCLPYHVPVILTTAYSNYGFEAYQHDVVDYLLKPISYPRFLKSINKAIKLIGIDKEKEEEPEFPEIELKYDGILKVIDTKRILFIEAVGNYIKIHLENEKPLLVTQTMKYIGSLLPRHYFTRVHKSYIVKREAIAEIRKTEITLTNKTVLPIGRKYSVLLE